MGSWSKIKGIREAQLRSRSFACTITCLSVVLLATSLVAQDVAFEPRRETWQRVPDLFSAAGVREGATIADIGAGDGFLTVRLAPAVGERGRVYAVDSDQQVISRLQKRVADAGMKQVDVILGAADDPHLPVRNLDGAIILNAYHEMAQGVVMLRHIHDALKSGAHLVLCEPVPDGPGQSRASQMEDHVLYPEIIVDDLGHAGFEVIDRQDSFAKNLGGSVFGFIVAKRP
jgi:predicted methyltransferase